MKQKWFVVSLGAIALVPTAGWSWLGATHAVSFTPPPGRAAPQQSTGGASRSGFFILPPGRTAPQQSIGGASRGSFFTPPPGRIAPSQSASGASRTNTYGDYLTGGEGIRAMLALTPDSFYGTTLRDRPTILVYVPASSAREGVFGLNDDSQSLIYEVEVSVPAEGGIIAIELPESAPALEIEENYQWFFSLKLEGELTPASPFVSGWVQRIVPTAKQAQSLATDDLVSHIAALGSQGIWYDTAAELALLHANQPSEAIARHWEELLESVGLTELARAPIVQL